MKYLNIKGAREHNLKNIDVKLPRDKFVVITGVSGSGKSSLAFDTIFAEGQRRYLESLSSYARQFLGQMQKPEVDHIEGLSPCIAIDQKSVTHNPRSTVGTVTEIHDYLRLLYAKIGIPHCPKCGREIVKLSVDEIVERVIGLGEKFPKAEILAPIVRDRKGEYLALLNEMYEKGFLQVYINGEKHNLTEWTKIKLAKTKKHSIDVLVDNVELHTDNLTRIFEDVEKALSLSMGLVKIKYEVQEVFFNQALSCPVHDIMFPVLEPRLFSFNSPHGACSTCDGLGASKEIDLDLLIPDQTITLAQGGVMPWSYKKNNYLGSVLKAVLNHFDISDNVRVKNLSVYEKKILLYGDDSAVDVKVRAYFRGGKRYFKIKWKGLIHLLENRYQKTESDAVRRDIEQYMSRRACPVCRGTRYKPEPLLVYVGSENIVDLSRLDIISCLKFIKKLKLTHQEKLIAKRILKEIIDRLGFLQNVGLGYLSLHRQAFSLSGGEMQRIRLASQIGSQLMGVLYVLDEPSIGLHARDNAKLLSSLEHLRDTGNTLLVIEHDEETMRRADYLVDMGPGAGVHGGQVIAQGTPRQVINNPQSLTGKYLRQELSIPVPSARRNARSKKQLIIRGACEHNLKNIDVAFPLKVFTVVTGVSGSGKSTLVEDIMYNALSAKLMRSLKKPGKHHQIDGVDYLDKVIMIDQSPIGRTPRSNPATYCGLFTPIRTLFAKTKFSRQRGYQPGRFSFNVPGGRCDNCNGDGFLKIEMQFMPDVYLPCDVCGGKRYNSETLQIKYKGKTIADILEMTVSQAVDFFLNFPEISHKLQLLEDVGLGYIRLGQRATTLSGGEAQRIKLASELSRKATGKTLYVLDEPTTGLHFEDISKLLNVLQRLVNAGNTVVVIEHNMDVIKSADWLIDMGPEGGDKGGKVLITGSPEEVIKYHKESSTARYLKEYLAKKS